MSILGRTGDKANGYRQRFGTMFLDAVQTVTGAKTWEQNTLLFSGSVSGYTTLNAGSAPSSNVLTLPTATGTLALTSDITASISVTGENYLSYGAGVITAAAVNLTGSNVTGVLKEASIPLFTGGDVTGPGGSAVLTLATVNANVGSFGSSTAIPSFTVNAKGLITAASTNAVVAPAGTLTGATLAANVLASSLTSVGTVTSGTWSGSFGAVSGANLTNLTAANISAGTAGIDISGNAATATTATSATNATNATNIGVSDAAGDTTTWVLLAGSQTGTQGALTDAGLTYQATTNALTATTFIGALSGNATTATALATPRTIGGVSFDGSANIVPQTIETANEAADTSCFLLFVTASGTQQLQPKNNTGLTYNASTNALGATTFTGALSGNATTATALATPRTIGGVSFDGSANIVPQTIESANEATDTTCFPLFITASGTQSLQPKNNANLTFNSNTATLSATNLGGTLTTASQPNVTGLGTVTTGTWSATTIAVDKGGTGQTSYTNGQLLIGNTTGNTLAKGTITQGGGITVTNGAGSITLGVSALQTAWIPAAAMRPSSSGGCAALALVASGANMPDISSLDFDASTAEYAQFSARMPKGWDEGTVTAAFVWSHAATVTNFGVVWTLQGVAIADNEAMGVAYGTLQQIADTGGTTDKQYTSGSTPAITIGGTPAAGETVYFRVGRLPTDGSDTLAVDARLHGIVLFYTINTLDDT